VAGHPPGEAFAELGYLRGILAKLHPPLAGADTFGPGRTVTAAPGATSLEEERSRRRMLLMRLAAVFYAGCGLLGLVTLPLPAPGSDRPALAVVYAAALAA